MHHMRNDSPDLIIGPPCDIYRWMLWILRLQIRLALLDLYLAVRETPGNTWDLD